MSEPKNPPLFAKDNLKDHRNLSTDITLRDLFAAAALAGFASATDIEGEWRGDVPDAAAENAYALADAALAEREKS